ncbi:Aste57867_24495 [Aphanomyces stellatus]|uniref:Aste57867_24495 protein n=1 Tax=Aphanomyces stellatus TaxID=120398 RepID=A0A485LQM7_9STRA|nr:hypothetical protein As57867_024418 [Aphanomyces stellatus]VFU01134.1 Aste57867_24495 [Aphanomyces stellatus]
METRVFVYKNEARAQAKVVTVKSTDSLATLKSACGKKLGIKAKRIFNATGGDVNSVAELANNDTLYVSTGEVFYKFAAGAPSTTGQETMQVSVLGSGGVGKSALTLRFVRDYFMHDWDPTIEDAYRKSIDVDGRLCLLEILDTAGQDDFESLRTQWMMDRHAYVFVYSMDSKSSLQQLEPFFELHQRINEYKRPMPPIVLVANKCDLVKENPSLRQVSSDEGRAVAASYKAVYMETSALTGENVSSIFEDVVRSVRRTKQAKPPRKRTACTIL